MEKLEVDAAAYDKAIARAQTIYSTPQLVKQCRNYWKLRWCIWA